MAVVREDTTILAVIGVGVDETLSLSDLFGQFEKGNVMLSVVETSIETLRQAQGDKWLGTSRSMTIKNNKK